MRWAAYLLCLLLPLLDLCWNLTHLNIGLADFYGLAAFARAYAEHGVWPATPYFPALYPLLLVPAGLAGSALIGGYILSALGLMLALLALGSLARAWGIGGAWLAVLLLLAWADPVFRVVAGSPSVDALYTGLALVFLAAALIIWKERGGAWPARWTGLALCVPAALLPLLRYHAVVLVLPVLLVLSWGARRHLGRIWPAWVALALALVFNAAVYYAAFGRAPQSAAGLQVRSGIELQQHIHYSDPQALWDDYPAFAAHGRATPLLQDYTPRQLAAHVLAEWGRFLRRPAIALALLLLLAALALRRPLPRAVALALVWAACYSLTLGSAYYTARAALLPVLVALAAVLALAAEIIPARRGWMLGAACVLLALGGAVFSRTMLADYRERAGYARLSREVQAFAKARGLPAQAIAAADWRVLPLTGNRWCAPYPHSGGSWLDDPAIMPSQRPGLTALPEDAVLAGETAVRLIAVPAGQADSGLARAAEDPRWVKAGGSAGAALYAPRGAPSYGGA